MTSINLAMNGGNLSWGELLARERKNHLPPYTQAELAKRCGVDLRAVEAWEKNERAPSGQALGRLYGSIASMRRHGVQLYELRDKLGSNAEALLPRPAPQAAAPAPAAEKPKTDPPPAPAATQAPAPAPAPAPQPKASPPAPAYAFATYGQALAWARLQSDFHQTELATLLGDDANQYDVSRWERDEVQPSAEQQAKLLALGGHFAALERAPAPTGRIRSNYRRKPTTGRRDIERFELPITPEPQPIATEEPKEPPMAVHAVKAAPAAPVNPPAPAADASPVRRFLAASRAVRASGQGAALAAVMRSGQWAAIVELAELAQELGMPLTELADELDR